MIVLKAHDLHRLLHLAQKVLAWHDRAAEKRAVGGLRSDQNCQWHSEHWVTPLQLQSLGRLLLVMGNSAQLMTQQSTQAGVGQGILSANPSLCNLYILQSQARPCALAFQSCKVFPKPSLQN